jgi:MOSC domain-containing protein YiiM
MDNHWLRVFTNIKKSNRMFGENLTVDGLKESEVSIGDVFQIGSSKIIVT